MAVSRFEELETWERAGTLAKQKAAVHSISQKMLVNLTTMISNSAWQLQQTQPVLLVD